MASSSNILKKQWFIWGAGISLSCLLPNMAIAQLVNDDNQEALDPRGPIISDEEFNESVPSIENDEIEDVIIEDAPINDPEIDAPLEPLAVFDLRPFDESEFTEAETETDNISIEYSYRIDGLDLLNIDSNSGSRPMDADDIISRFNSLSALKNGDGKASNGAMVAARMTEDQQLLVDILSGQGYFDASVNGAAALAQDENEAQSGALNIILTVSPGKRYELATINFDLKTDDIETNSAENSADVLGTQESLSQNLIAQNFAPKVGDPIVAERILASEANLSIILPENGYPFAQTGQRDILLDPQTGTADYSLPVNLGPRSSFGDIITSGNIAFDANHIAVLRRFEKGALYDSRQIDDLRQAMIATGLFSTIAIEALPSGETAPDGSEYATINVIQEAGPARTLAASGGFATGQGLTIEGSWTHRNLFPPQGALIGSVIAGTQEQGLSAIFRRNNAGRRDRTAEFTISALRNDFEAFEAFTGRIAGRISYDSTPIWQKRISYNYGFEILATNEQDFNFDTGERDRRTFYVAALPSQIRYDSSNSLLNPTQGFRLTATLSPEASLGSGTQFYGRSVAEGTGYVQASDNFVLAGRLRVASIAGVDRESIAPSRRFYAGGGGSVRGFGFQDVGPIDTEGRPIGGRSLVEGAAELRYRFGDYGAVAFVDAGQVYTSSIPEFDDLRYGIGVGARLYTNFGPLRFDIATPINRQEGESIVSVYISIGQAF